MMTMRLRAWKLALVGLVLGGCGDDGGTRDVGGEGEVDAVDTGVGDDGDVGDTGEVDASDIDAGDAGEVDAGESEVDASDIDADADASDVDVSEPRVCGDFEACDALLNPDGACPGTCRSTDDTLRCTGTVKHAVCHSLEPVETPTEAVDFGAFTVTPVRWPADAVVAETFDLEVRLSNDTDAPLTVPLRWKQPGTFSFADVSWESVDHFDLAAGGSVSLTARVTALLPSTLSAGANIIVTLVFGADAVFEPRATVHFPETEAIACGGEHFPETWCAGEGCYSSRAFYASARCCDDVFFPGATCCDDVDCVNGACVDGRCVFETPYLTSANNVPVGHQRIRLVLVDTHPQFTDPCVDHYEDARGEFDFATTEAWYDDLSQRRIGRNSVDFKWIVTGGVATSDFLTGPNYWDDYSRELNAYLEQRGCPIFDAYDKVIVSAGTIDLQGFGGIYINEGNIAVFSAHGPYLVAHELAHSFGATDLYLDLAGTFLYPRALMGNNLSAPPLPSDQVAWGEMGFADIDRNGVVDVVEIAGFPESLAVANATATLTTKGSIEIRWEFVANQGGLPMRVIVPTYTISVPAANASFEQYYPGRWKVVAFDGTQVDLAAIEAAGVIEVGLGVSYRFTGRDWQPKVLSFDETLQIPVTRQP